MATRKHKPPNTALQSNYGFTALDDYDMRMYVLPALIDRDSREQIIAEHRALPCTPAPNPVNQHRCIQMSDKLIDNYDPAR